MRRSEKYNLVVLYPEFAKQWHPTKNEKGPEFYTPGSQYKAWWCEEFNGVFYEWSASICNRIRQGQGNPYLSGRRAGYGNDLATLRPDLAAQWHPTRNEKGPECYTLGSGKNVWWINVVGDVTYEWISSIVNRVKGGGNPYISRQAIGYGNDLATNYPDLVKKWNYIKNEKGPEVYAPGSGAKVWWCEEVGGVFYEWEAVIKKMVAGAKNPYLSGRRVGYGNDLSTLRPDLADEWHKIKNKNGPECYTLGSEYNAWWCHECKDGVIREWQARIYSRTGIGGSGCSFCSSGPLSSASQYWLDSLSIPNEFGTTREVRIKLDNRYIKVDGFDPTTHTIYEFLGNYFHGNPEVFDPKDINPTISKAYGQLYDETLKRFDLIKQFGYNIKYVWESDPDTIFAY